jgi:hypothetical protein
VKQDGKNEGLFWRSFRLLKSETIADLHGKSIGFATGSFLYRLFGEKYGMKSIQISHSD